MPSSVWLPSSPLVLSSSSYSTLSIAYSKAERHLRTLGIPIPWSGQRQYCLDMETGLVKSQQYIVGHMITANLVLLQTLFHSIFHFHRHWNLIYLTRPNW